MTAEVDIKQLAIVRDALPTPRIRRCRHVVSRYLIPGALLLGFAAVVLWASRDRLSPPRDVWVVPAVASQSVVQNEATPVFQAAGWIEPRPTPIRVAALAPGVVERLLVVQDQPVKAGEPVADLIKADAKLACDREAANLTLHEAELAEAEAGLQAAATRLEQPVHLLAVLGDAEAALAQIITERRNLPFATRRAEAQLTFAEKDYQGKQASQAAVSGRAIHEAKSNLEVARAMVDELHDRTESLANQEQALLGRRDALRTQVTLLADEKQAKDEAEAQVQAAKARVEQARLALAEAKLRLERMTVRAPVDGRVYQLVAYPGTTLTGGMSSIPNADAATVVTLYQPELLQVRVDARFEDIPKVSLGQRVQINNPALAEPLTGTVLFVSSEANIQKNTLQVKVAIDSPAKVFKPEMLVDVTFLAPKAAASIADASEVLRLYLPQHVIQRDDSGSFVWVADQSDGVARKVSVTLGAMASGGLVEVRGDMTVATRAVARGYDNLTDGARIRVVSEDPDQFAALPSADSSEPFHRLPHEGE
jgi:HlyD family secretion protein